MTDLTERMAAAFWKAFEDGMIQTANVAYPAWDANSPMAQETYRCMRHAVEALIERADEEDFIFAANLRSLFPNPPMSRAEAVSEMKMRHLPLIQIMAGAHATLDT